MSADRHNAGLCLQVQLNKKAIQATLAYYRNSFNLILEHSKFKIFYIVLVLEKQLQINYTLKTWDTGDDNNETKQSHLTSQ